MVLMEYSGARGTLIYEKNLKAKSCVRLPLILCIGDCAANFLALLNLLCGIFYYIQALLNCLL